MLFHAGAGSGGRFGDVSGCLGDISAEGRIFGIKIETEKIEIIRGCIKIKIGEIFVFGEFISQ